MLFCIPRLCSPKRSLRARPQVHYGKGPTAKSKTMVFWLLWLCLKRYYSHFWHVDANSHCADNGLVFLQKFFVSCQYACGNSIFEKTENGKVKP